MSCNGVDDSGLNAGDQDVTHAFNDEELCLRYCLAGGKPALEWKEAVVGPVDDQCRHC